MNKRKHYGRKIKKTKNLYRKKKTAGQKAFGTVMLVLAVSAIAFLGFCIGKPLLDYLGNIGTKDIPEWTPEASYSEKIGSEQPTEVSEPDGTSAPEVTERTDTETAKDVQSGYDSQTAAETYATIPLLTDDTVFRAVEVPTSALANRSALSAVLAKARSGGYDTVVVQLKDKNGYFHYKTEIEGTEDIIAGTMTLEEIMGAFKENGIVPIAEIAVLADNMGCKTFTEMSFKVNDGSGYTWLDKYQSRWADPNNDAVREYFAMISAELITGGFENIILTDVVYPEIPTNDNLHDPRCDDPDRYKALYNVIKAGNIIEVKASDLFGETYGRTAEIFYDTSKLHDNKIAVVISREDLPVKSGYPADAKSLAESVLFQAKAKAAGVTLIPLIDGQSFDDAEKTKIIAALEKMGYDSYIVR